MNSYNPKDIEPKWQKTWLDRGDWKADDDSNKPKYYVLIEFPYPSGDGMHVGHLRSNTAMDVIARKRRREGYNVLFPIGWDAFGLPAENYAIKTGTHPKITTKTNTDNFRRQLQAVGFTFDWSREVNTTDPNYYKFTQWIFLELFKNGFAYKAKVPINWCPKDKVGLANEEVVDGACERCGTLVEQKEKEQWMLKITAYADRLAKDLDTLDFIEPVKIQQKNWIEGLRDWVFSRQRYWGEPIPMVHCSKCDWVPVPEESLPVVLPDIAEFKPGENGDSPLIHALEWVHTACPSCGGAAKRETDVMPNWAGSSWYFLAYAGFNALFENPNLLPSQGWKLAAKKFSTWMPVDWYNGGMEHTTLHLLYSRFWNKFLNDQGHVPVSEPYKKRTSHGLILAAGGEKMSKSKGNVVNPDALIDTVGADALRLYILFMGPFDQAVAWSEDGIVGPRRFLERVWALRSKVGDSSNSQTLPELEKAIEKVGRDIEGMSFNTAISSLMICLNALEKESGLSQNTFERFLLLLAPFAPHISEELWSGLSHTTSIHHESWPEAQTVVATEIRISIQVNGKPRGQVVVSAEATEENVIASAKAADLWEKWVGDKEIIKTIYIPGRTLSIVTKE